MNSSRRRHRRPVKSDQINQYSMRTFWTFLFALTHAAPILASEFDCLIEARQTVEIRSSVEAVIEKIHVGRGDYVRKGDVLVTLESGAEKAALELARSRSTMQGEINAAQARLELARKKWMQANELYEQKFVSASARDEAVAEYKLASEQLRQARENRILAELEVKRNSEILAHQQPQGPDSETRRDQSAQCGSGIAGQRIRAYQSGYEGGGFSGTADWRRASRHGKNCRFSSRRGQRHIRRAPGVAQSKPAHTCRGQMPREVSLMPAQRTKTAWAHPGTTGRAPSTTSAMPGKIIKACVTCLLLITLAAFGSVAEAAKAQVNSKVPAGKWKAVRLKNLPEGASLGVRVAANGSMVVILVHEAELKRYPAPISPAFQGTLERTLSFSVVIPESGNYYVILDNRRGADERRVRILIQANAPRSRATPPNDSGGGKEKI
jgi:pyruvate/2-oxoglutarate dehydrogenase complex dihydrolipoamide acyltransferase (E2) component